jgi:multicomponent Na+:H+ antiporter subunit F
MSDPVSLAVDASLAILSLALVLAFLRLARGPSLADRVVALDVAGATIVSAAIVHAVGSGLAVFVDVALVIALIAFLGTVAMARAVESEGAGR